MALGEPGGHRHPLFGRGAGISFARPNFEVEANGLREWKGPRVAGIGPRVKKTASAQSERSACVETVCMRSVLGQQSAKSQSK